MFVYLFDYLEDRERANAAAPKPKILHPSQFVELIAPVNPLPSAVQGSRREGTALVITVSPVPGKYADGEVRKT